MAIRFTGDHRAAQWVLVMALALGGCTPSIGDRCTSSTDCSVQGNRTCDTSQPCGYCTILGCGGNSCLSSNNAACVVFRVSIPGCTYDDYHAPARTGRALCMAHCDRDSDCRQSDGYVCADPTGPPWRAAILDDTPTKVCIQPGSTASPFTNDASCSAPESGTPDAGSPGMAPDASGDASPGAPADAGSDAGASDASEGG